MSRYYPRAQTEESRLAARYDALDRLIELIIIGESERRYQGKKSPRTIHETDEAYSNCLRFMGIPNGKHETV